MTSTITTVVTSTAVVNYNGHQYSFTNPSEGITYATQITGLNAQINSLTTQLNNAQSKLANAYVSLGALCTSANQIA